MAKHGNRSVSSLCGSADVVETLGINLELTPAKVGRCIDEVGIGFLYAPLLHTAMKHVMPARREMGIRTVFNMLGPLTNPAGANAQVIGVYAAALTEPLARVLAELGTIARLRRPRRRRPRRDLQHRREPGPRCARAWCGRSPCGPRTSACPAPRSATSRAATARRTPRSSAQLLGGEPGPRRTSC